MGTQFVMAGFEDDIQRAAVLATFVPLIISSGGNSGSQATALVIRALAVGEITLRDWVQVLKRELVGGILLGAALGLVGMARIHLWGWMQWFIKHDGKGQILEESQKAQDHYGVLAVSIGAAVVGVVLWGTVVGAMLPFALKKLKFDPATSSAPVVATLVDIMGVLIYFTAASLILRGTLL
jgi:magnesium transporter